MSKLFFSPKTNGFYDSDFNEVIPEEAIEISQELHQSLMEGDSAGKVISSDKDGNPILVDPVEVLTLEEKISRYTKWVQRALDDKAKEYEYDSISNAISYADEPAVVKFQKEGQAFRSWRSLVWVASYEILDKFKAGDIPEPTYDQIVAQLPVFTAPS